MVVETLWVGAGTSLVSAEVSSVVEGHSADPGHETVSVAVAVVFSVAGPRGTDPVMETGAVVTGGFCSEVGAGNVVDSILVAGAVLVMTTDGEGRVTVTRGGTLVGVTTGEPGTGRVSQGEVVAVQVWLHSVSVTVTVSQSVSVGWSDHEIQVWLATRTYRYCHGPEHGQQEVESGQLDQSS